MKETVENDELVRILLCVKGHNCPNDQDEQDEEDDAQDERKAYSEENGDKDEQKIRRKRFIFPTEFEELKEKLAAVDRKPDVVQSTTIGTLDYKDIDGGDFEVEVFKPLNNTIDNLQEDSPKSERLFGPIAKFFGIDIFPTNILPINIIGLQVVLPAPGVRSNTRSTAAKRRNQGRSRSYRRRQRG